MNLTTAVEKNGATMTTAEMFKLRCIDKLTYEEIAEKAGISFQAVSKRLNRFLNILEDTEALEVYRQRKTDIMDAAEMTILMQAVQPDVLKKASHNNLMYGFGSLHNANRLEKGLSTDNLAAKMVFQIVQEPQDTVSNSDNDNHNPLGDAK